MTWKGSNTKMKIDTDSYNTELNTRVTSNSQTKRSNISLKYTEKNNVRNPIFRTNCEVEKTQQFCARLLYPVATPQFNTDHRTGRTSLYVPYRCI